jgi:hypothetical protein
VAFLFLAIIAAHCFISMLHADASMVRVIICLFHIK